MNILKRGSVAQKILRLIIRLLLGSRVYEKVQFRRHVGYWPDLDNPITFNEKVCARKFNNDLANAPVLADKYAVREYVSSRVGDWLLNDIICLIEEPREIDISRLPSSFVMKGTNGSGHDFMLIVQGYDALNEKEIKQAANKILQQRQSRLNWPFWYSNEWWYGRIKPRIIIEPHLLGGGSDVPLDYKFYVFHGQVRLIQVDFDRFKKHTRSLFDRNWTLLPFNMRFERGGYIEPPATLADMIKVSERLGAEFDFIRVDLYCVNDTKIVFGELTFAPDLGHSRFTPQSYDRELGSMW